MTISKVAMQAGRLFSKEADASVSEAVGYLDDALAFLAPPTPCLVAIGGLSGTGNRCMIIIT